MRIDMGNSEVAAAVDLEREQHMLALVDLHDRWNHSLDQIKAAINRVDEAVADLGAQLPRGVGEFQQNEALLALRGLRWAMALAKGLADLDSEEDR
jgi:hypothetical protein